MRWRWRRSQGVGVQGARRQAPSCCSLPEDGDAGRVVSKRHGIAGRRGSVRIVEHGDLEWHAAWQFGIEANDGAGEFRTDDRRLEPRLARRGNTWGLNNAQCLGPQTQRYRLSLARLTISDY